MLEGQSSSERLSRRSFLSGAAKVAKVGVIVGGVGAVTEYLTTRQEQREPGYVNPLRSTEANTRMYAMGLLCGTSAALGAGGTLWFSRDREESK